MSIPSNPKNFIPWIVLCALLVLPALALWHLISSTGFSAWWALAGVSLAMSAVTVFLYWNDKRRAERQATRIPEATLHIAELVGGWPGAFIAQRVLRHKSAKLSYRIVFWGIVVIHQLVAFEILTGGLASKGVLRLMYKIIG